MFSKKEKQKQKKSGTDSGRDDDLATSGEGPRPRLQQTSQTAGQSGDQAVDDQQKLTTKGSRWDTAYDALKEDKLNPIAEYEDLLSRVLTKARTNTSSDSHKEEDTGRVLNQIPQHDVIERQRILKEITVLGLKHMDDKKVGVTVLGHEIVLQDQVKNVVEAVEWAEGYITAAVKDLPYASTVWAGVSLVLPLLKNPTIVEAANKEGFTYVTSQMRYYNAMESLLLPEGMTLDLKVDLGGRLVDLYKLIIDFQIRSIIRFYRSRTNNFFRSTLNNEGWDKKRQEIQKSADVLVQKFETAMSGISLDISRHSLRQLTKFAEEAAASYKTLDKLLVTGERHLQVAQDSRNYLQIIAQDILDPKSQNYRCLQSLRITNPRNDKKNIEDVKGGLLADSYRWILDNADFRRWRDDEQSRLLWIKADPGKGKTMLLCGIIDELSKSTTDTGLLSFFFCQATDTRINNAIAVLRGLIYLLVAQQPMLLSHVRKEYDRDGEELFRDVGAWVALSRIFANILQDPNLKSAYLIVDALDECVVDLPRLLKFVVEQSATSTPVKWIVSSRNWPDIEEQLKIAAQKETLSLELNVESVSNAVGIYIQHKVLQLTQIKGYDTKTRDAVQRYLSSNANDTFLWVALVCQNLEKIPRRKTLKMLDAFPPGLDSLYERMMEHICKIEDIRDVNLCKQILALVTIVRRPITLQELTSLADELEDVSDDLESLREIIGLCGSFLVVRQDTVYFVHQSAQDFLLGRASDDIFPHGIEQSHHTILLRSLEVMSRTLRRDMYGPHAPGFPIDKVKQPEQDLLSAIGYSYINWIDHLCDSDSSERPNRWNDLQDDGLVHKFLREKYLYWLEALSLLRNMPEGVLSVTKLKDFVLKEENTSALIDLVRDAHRFILYFKRAIENSPLQAYASALVFSPVRSPIRELFKQDQPEWIATSPAMEDNWSVCIQTLEGHGSSVLSVAFSDDSKLLASGSDDSMIKIWDVTTGQEIRTLEGHCNLVMSVAFSNDSKLLASGSFDKTIKI
ncbi:MAG: hypothetical protein M1839_003535 [Geoglossum umbratile]|nr:MAG: hypothetical protein M1839_003535 [Geoglossum umbratile]